MTDWAASAGWYTDRRYLNQRSVFSCPADPHKSLEGSEKLVIKAAWKSRLREILRTFGIAHSFIYPGLEGCAREIRATYFDPVKAGRLNIQSFATEFKL